MVLARCCSQIISYSWSKVANILLVEPDRLLAETYAQALTTAGHKVVPCASAQAAIMAADQIKPDVVVLELQLIEHSGIEFLYEFRSYVDWQSVPVIVQTHVPASEFKTNWQSLKQQLGIEVYLYKPQTSLKQLISSVNSQVQQVQQAQQVQASTKTALPATA